MLSANLVGAEVLGECAPSIHLFDQMVAGRVDGDKQYIELFSVANLLKQWIIDVSPLFLACANDTVPHKQKVQLNYKLL